MNNKSFFLLFYIISGLFLYILIVHDVYYNGLESSLVLGDSLTYFFNSFYYDQSISDIIESLSRLEVGATLSLFGISSYASFLRSFSQYGILLSIVINILFIYYTFSAIKIFVFENLYNNGSLLSLIYYLPLPFSFLFGPTKEIFSFLLVGLLFKALRFRALYPITSFASLIARNDFFLFFLEYCIISIFCGFFREVNIAISFFSFVTLFFFSKTSHRIFFILASFSIMTILIPPGFADLLGNSGLQASTDLRQRIYEVANGKPWFLLVYSICTYPITVVSSFSAKSVSNFLSLNDLYMFFRIIFSSINFYLLFVLARILVSSHSLIKFFSVNSINIFFITSIFILLYGFNPSSVIRQFIPIYPLLLVLAHSLKLDSRVRIYISRSETFEPN